MKKSALSTFLMMSYSSFAQEEKIEVGKHVTGSMDAVSMIMSLIIVLGVIFFSAFILKRLQPTIKQSQGLKIVTSLHLGPKERLVVAQVGDEQLLLGVTAGQINLIKPLDTSLEVKAPISNEFSDSLLSLLKGKPANHASTLGSEK